jgi:hypothetical protein
MKRIIIIAIVIFATQTLSAKLFIGVSGTFEFPSSKTAGINAYLAGPELEFSYLYRNEKIMTGLNWQYRWIMQMPNNQVLSSYMATVRYFPFESAQTTRPYISSGFGYYHTKEDIMFGDGSIMTISEDGAVIRPSLGILSAAHLVSGLYLDVGIFYQYYSTKSRPSGMGFNAGIKYRF